MKSLSKFEMVIFTLQLCQLQKSILGFCGAQLFVLHIGVQ